MWQTFSSYGTRGKSCPSRNRKTYARLVPSTNDRSMIQILSKLFLNSSLLYISKFDNPKNDVNFVK